jgi:hypothetical protein
VAHPQGNAAMDLAEVLLMAGRPREALASAEDAVRHFGIKGDSESALRAQHFTSRIVGDTVRGW